MGYEMKIGDTGEMRSTGGNKGKPRLRAQPKAREQ